VRPLYLCIVLTACGFQAADPTSSTPGVDAPPRIDGSSPTPSPTIDAPTSVDAAPLTAASFMYRMIRIECEQAFVCRPQYTTTDPSFATAWGTDLDDCVANDVDYRQVPRILTAIGGGTITFDPGLAASCLAAPGIPTSCATLFSHNYQWTATCYAAVLGHVADGGGCITDWECALASVCRSGKCMR